MVKCFTTPLIHLLMEADFWVVLAQRHFDETNSGHSKQFVAHVYVLESFSKVNGNFECRSKY